MAVSSGARLAGKGAFVTGAASGLGKAIAAAFAAEGSRVAVADIDVARGGDAAAALGAQAIFLRHDVTEEQHWVQNLAAADEAFGGLHILVNSAGIAPRGNIETTELKDWRRVQAVNLDGTFLGCKHAIRYLAAAGGGAIVNLSSVAGLIGARDFAAYCASKGGVRLLTKSVALHCAHRKNGVRCNSLHPVYCETPMLDAMLAESADAARTRRALEGMIPLGRLGTPEELAQMAVYLASDEARFVTGAEFVFDGGYTAN